MKTLASEDPTCRFREDEETGQTILSGMGELHLEILVDRLKRVLFAQHLRSPVRARTLQNVSDVREGRGNRHLSRPL